MTIVTADVVDGLVPDLDAARCRQDGPDCPWCVDDLRAEARLCRQLAKALADSAVHRGFSRSTGLCARHVAQVAARQHDGAVQATLYDTYAAQLSALHPASDTRHLPHSILDRQRVLAHELAEFARKHDYRYQHEGWGSERTAVERALAWLVGAPGLPGGPVPALLIGAHRLARNRAG